MAWKIAESPNRAFWLVAPRSRAPEKTCRKIEFEKATPIFGEGQEAKTWHQRIANQYFLVPFV